MVKICDIAKVILLLQLAGICCAMPFGDDVNYDTSVSGAGSKVGRFHQRITPQFDRDFVAFVPRQFGPYQIMANNPLYNERGWLPYSAPPSKRNSELINSLLGLPKNMESAGK
jgi:Pigment-dispersing hormone (PDH)